MINNLSSDTPGPIKAPVKTFEEKKQEYARLCAEHCADGTLIGFLGFVKKNNVDLSRGPNCKVEAPAIAFMDALTCEMDDKSKDKFPLKESFIKFTTERILRDGENLIALYSFGYLDAMGAIAELAAASATAEYLEANREPVLKLIREIRGVD